jgi:hypothetical protein
VPEIAAASARETMAARYKDKEGGVVVSVNGAWVSYLHTVIAYSEQPLLPFFSAPTPSNDS